MSSRFILVAGPYRSGTDGEPARIAANVDAVTAIALVLWRRGHRPVMGAWFGLVERVDGRLRIGGPSEGADRMVRGARELGKEGWFALDEVPPA